MRTQSDTAVPPIPPERLAEAGVWVARLHSGEPDRAAAAGVRQWMSAHPMNKRALELCTEMWEESDNLRRIIPFATHVPAGRRPYARLLIAAGAFALIMSIALWFVSRADVATEVGEQRLVTLKDGTRVFLNTATRVAVNYDSSGRFVELKAGEALFEVAKRPNWPFIVKAGDHDIRAFGTSFVVRRDAIQTSVTLVEGTVTVTADRSVPSTRPPDPGIGDQNSAQAFTLTPGQRLTFLAGNARLDTPSLDKATAWRRNQIVLDDTPLSAAVYEMNRYSKFTLVVERPEAQAILVNGLFQTGDSLSFANAVAQTYGLTVEERNDKIVLSGAPAPRRPSAGSH
jgi:transmembrane sensor